MVPLRRSRARRRPSAREAVRINGETWRYLERVIGDPCLGCGRCDRGASGHDGHECTVTPAWFAGTDVLCHMCFAAHVWNELHGRNRELRGLVDRAALGDGDALRALREEID